MAVDFEKVLPIIAPIITFIIGMKFEHSRIKKSNVREKAKQIDIDVMDNLKNISNKIEKSMNDKNYISFNSVNTSATLNLNGYEYANILAQSGIFRVKDNKIILSYKKDKILKQHARMLIKHIENYQSNAFNLKDIIDGLNESIIPPDYEGKLIDLLNAEFGAQNFGAQIKKYKSSFILYVVSISGSEKSHTSGRTYEIDIIKKRYEDLQNIVRNNPKCKNIFFEIESSINNMLSSLKSIRNEIDELHDEWQNKYIF